MQSLSSISPAALIRLRRKVSAATREWQRVHDWAVARGGEHDLTAVSARAVLKGLSDLGDLIYAEGACRAGPRCGRGSRPPHDRRPGEGTE